MRKLAETDPILIVGAGDYPIYETALYEGLIALGYAKTSLFTWNSYYSGDGILRALIKRAEIKASYGFIAARINKELLEYCVRIHPALVFLYTCRLIYPETAKRIHDMGICLVSYCNDNPFSDYFPSYFWRNYIRALPYCDINYGYRKENLEDIRKKTGRAGKLLRSYYIAGKNYPCMEKELLPDTPEVIFLGHYEDDYRKEYLEALREAGITVGLPKQEFSSWAEGKKGIILLEDTRRLYNNYLCSCKVPITFLSTLNRDTYTRRCFEIPAAGALLFSLYTEDLASLFDEDKEAVFFRGKQDFIQKLQYYLVHDEERKRIAEVGRQRILKDGHEVRDRAKQILRDVGELQQKGRGKE
ncbi:glycosyltransferase family protein [Lachnoclostridium sp. Marseille-P6806]|uniref:glycosyltransferase family protein n=1 Tax=Lachnoclostridium sp. Marseille-P6806 TaxID=2364793 RepID=UPI001030BCEB|nr:glycosyltransferase [Lachnoclostridium sp. Marseille-P6806]